jgi:hypothetical protein
MFYPHSHLNGVSCRGEHYMPGPKLRQDHSRLSASRNASETSGFKLSAEVQAGGFSKPQRLLDLALDCKLQTAQRDSKSKFGDRQSRLEKGGGGGTERGAGSWPPPACCECTRGEHSSASRAYVAPENIGSRAPLKLRLARCAPKPAVIENKHSTETLYVLLLLRASSVSMSIHPDGKPRHGVLRFHSSACSQ